MKIRHLLLTILALGFAATTYAQENREQSKKKSKFKLNGLFRTIGEYRDGYAKPIIKDAGTPGTVIRNRIQLNALYTSDKFSTKLTIQDARAWGSSYILKEEGYSAQEGDIYETPLHVYEAWAQYNINKNWGIRLGRQEMKYGEGRVMWHRAWRDQGLTHDAAVLRYEKEKTKFHFAFSKSSNFMTHTSKNWAGSPYVNSFGYHKHMALAFFTTELAKDLKLNLLDVVITTQGSRAPESVYAKNTVGGNLLYKKKEGFLGGLTFYHQMGEVESTGAEAKEVSAMMFDVNAGYKTDKYMVKVGYDYYSGQKADEDKITSFDMLYSGRHKFDGRMDYFFSTPTYGLSDLYLLTSYKVNKKTELTASYHMFAATEEIPNLDSKSYGSEVDLALSTKLAKGVGLKLGYSFYLPNDGTRAIKLKGSDADLRFANYGWVMISFKPKFIN